MKKVVVLLLIVVVIGCLVTACSPNKEHDTFDTTILPTYSYVLNEQSNGLGIENFKVIPRKCSELDKWNVDGALAVNVSNVNIEK